MQIALISDIHGNDVALQAVLDEVDDVDPDGIVCLGDVALFGPQPSATTERIRSLGCPVILGNTDEFVLTGEAKADKPQMVLDISEWGVDQLSNDHHREIESYEDTVEIDPGTSGEMLCYHGSPRSPWEHVHVDAGGELLDDLHDLTDASLLVGGHTHDQMYRRHREATFVNAGSVGYPTVETGEDEGYVVPVAEWALVTASNGSVSVELRRTPFDLGELLEVTRNTDMPHREEWITGWRAAD